MRSTALLLLLVLPLADGCGDGTPATEVDHVTSALANSAGAAPGASPSGASASVSALTSAAPATTPVAAQATPEPAWHGLPDPRGVAIARTRRFKAAGMDLSLDVPTGWSCMEQNNGMSETTEALLARPPDKSAAIVIYIAATRDPWLIENGGGAWFAVSGGAGVKSLTAGEPITLKDVSFVPHRGLGSLWSRPASILELRRPTGRRGTLIVAAALRDDAPEARKAELAAVFDSLIDHDGRAHPPAPKTP